MERECRKLLFYFTELVPRHSTGSENVGNNLHVSGLSHDVDSGLLERIFSKVGRVRGFVFFSLNRSDSFLPPNLAFYLIQPHPQSFHQVQKATVTIDPHTRLSRGFGFVTMETPEEAEAAIVALDATELEGKVVRVEKVRSVESIESPSCELNSYPSRQDEDERERQPQDGTADHQKDSKVFFSSLRQRFHRSSVNRRTAVRSTSL